LVFVYTTVYSPRLHESVVTTVTEYSPLPEYSEVTLVTPITYWSPTVDRYEVTYITYTSLVPTSVHLDYTIETFTYTVSYYSPRAHNFLTATETYIETVAYYPL